MASLVDSTASVAVVKDTIIMRGGATAAQSFAKTTPSCIGREGRGLEHQHEAEAKAQLAEVRMR